MVSDRAMRSQRGFTFIGLLIAIAVLSVGLTAAAEVWVTVARHQKLAQLQWVGAQYVQAIGSYYYASPGTVKTYPGSLEELLEDRRYLGVRRHLRQLYVNPFSAQADWALVRSGDGRVQGVAVRMSDGTPLRFVHTVQGL